MNEELLHLDANGGFATPQMIEHVATQWNGKNAKNPVAYLVVSEGQLQKFKLLYGDGGGRPGVMINKTQQIFGHIPVRAEKGIPDTEILFRDKAHRVVAKVVGLER